LNRLCSARYPHYDFAIFLRPLSLSLFCDDVNVLIVFPPSVGRAGSRAGLFRSYRFPSFIRAPPTFFRPLLATPKTASFLFRLMAAIRFLSASAFFSLSSESSFPLVGCPPPQSFPNSCEGFSPSPFFPPFFCRFFSYLSGFAPIPFCSFLGEDFPSIPEWRSPLSLSHFVFHTSGSPASSVIVFASPGELAVSRSFHLMSL